MKLVFTEEDQNKVLHILRNPSGYTEEQIRKARQDGAELIERWQSAYKSVCNYALSKGLNLTAEAP
jgi:hypothetical protein